MLWNAFDHVNLARALLSHGHYDGALTACSIGLRRTPESAELHVLLARAYDGLGHPNEALAACERALELEHDGPSALAARLRQALIFFDAGDVAQAFAMAERAWNLAPGNVNVHTLIGNLLAWNGDLSGALSHVECNWLNELTSCLKRFGGRAPWGGGDLTGTRMLVVHQQGFGDMLQMARYLPALRQRAERVIVECLRPIAGIMRRMPGVDEVVEHKAADPASYDAYVRLMSLPRILGIDAGIAPPYLVPERERSAYWKAQLSGYGGYRVGLTWGGNPANVFDFARSLSPKRLAPLGGIPNVRYFSLMMEPDVDVGFDIVRIGESFRDFDDAAAAIAQLDLVISVDTAYAHLAGALGVPVWTMLQHRPDWRWAGNGENTSWYPSMRLFRERDRAWSTVIDRVVPALSCAGSRRMHDEARTTDFES
ncbi:MAG TPA: tetratricopeptide repeat protein [Candidatus Baltobacteraceae bacterium]|nr:tetratricopeptide repeat protein [Candidatus Baltobacteraceae bacterium]